MSADLYRRLYATGTLRNMTRRTRFLFEDACRTAVVLQAWGNFY